MVEATHSCTAENFFPSICSCKVWHLVVKPNPSCQMTNDPMRLVVTISKKRHVPEQLIEQHEIDLQLNPLDKFEQARGKWLQA